MRKYVNDPPLDQTDVYNKKMIMECGFSKQNLQIMRQRTLKWPLVFTSVWSSGTSGGSRTFEKQGPFWGHNLQTGAKYNVQSLFMSLMAAGTTRFQNKTLDLSKRSLLMFIHDYPRWVLGPVSMRRYNQQQVWTVNSELIYTDTWNLSF